MRRHYLFAEDANEHSVGDGNSSLLTLWLQRRQQLLAHEQLRRHLLFFWDLAKPKECTIVGQSEYVAFFQNVAKALFPSVSGDAATVVARKDWLYDSAGNSTLTLDLFIEALFQIAELLLPLESDVSMYASFFLELREAIAMPDDRWTPEAVRAAREEMPGQAFTAESRLPVDLAAMSPLVSKAQLLDALSYTLRGLSDVNKIRGAFLQKMPPGHDQLQAIYGLAPPDSHAMSLKQLLLAYNPRKFALSRKFASLLHHSGNTCTTDTLQHDDLDSGEASLKAMGMAPKPRPAVTSAASAALPPLTRPAALFKERCDPWSFEEAVVEQLEQSPAHRITVVGAPCTGKTKLARHLAQRLRLQYWSFTSVLEVALERKKKRRFVRELRRQQQQQEAAEAEAAAATDGAAEPQAAAASTEEGGADDASAVDGGAPAAPKEEVHEEDLLLTDEDMDALLHGGVLPRDVAIKLVIYYATQTLLAGVGIVLDDVFPSELSGQVALDYVVMLDATKDESKRLSEQLMIGPTTHATSSLRERVMLTRDSTLIQSSGFLDVVAPKPVVVVEDTAQTNAVTSPTATDADGEMSSPRDDASEAPADAEEEQDGESSKEPVAQPDPIGEMLTRNYVTAPTERTVSLQAQMAASFAVRYKAFDRRFSMSFQFGKALDPRTEIIRVLACQALDQILQQCIEIITENSVGISRASASRRVLPLLLPDDVVAAPRAEQLRWLLYGEMMLSNVNVVGSEQEATPLPTGKRRLSRWQEFCPVTSSSGALVLGDPLNAAVFSGFIYLLASVSARDAFCAAPWQFLWRAPRPKPADRVWLFSSMSLTRYLPAITAALGLPSAVAPESALQGSDSFAQGAISVADTATALADTLRTVAQTSTSQRWLLSDLPPTSDTVDVLKNAELLLPETLVLLVPDEDTIAQVAKNPMDSLLPVRHQQFQAKWLSDMQTLEALCSSHGMMLQTCSLFADVDETAQELLRLLDPLALRVDREDAGHVVMSDGTALFTPAEPSEATTDPSLDEQAAKLLDMGETGPFCAVTWHRQGLLIPGVAEFISSVRGRWYAFAGKPEMDAFVRYPGRFIPRNPQTAATGLSVPVVLLLGVRGAQVGTLARHVQERTRDQSCMAKRQRYVCVDVQRISTAVDAAERTDQLRASPMFSRHDVYVRELGQELTRLRQSSDPESLVIVLPGLSSEASGIPSVELLAVCFQAGLFPTVVMPLTITEGASVRAGLQAWAASQPSPRPVKVAPSKKRRGNNEDEGAPEDEQADEAAINPEEAEAEQRQRLTEQHQSDQEALTAAVKVLQARNVAVHAPIDVSGTIRHGVKALLTSLNTYIARRPAWFSCCRPHTLERAMALLQTGQVIVGKHGTYCPVRRARFDLRAPTTTILEYRSRLYFLSTRAAAVEFQANPSRWTATLPSVTAAIRPTCGVVGPPNSYKTQLAQALARHFDLVYVSPQSALEWVEQCYGNTDLARLLHATTSAGIPPDALTTYEMLVARVRSAECQRRGWVLDDWLATPEELHRLERDVQNDELALAPATLLVADRSLQHWFAHHQLNDKPSPLQVEALVAQYTAWQKHKLELLHYYSRTFGASHVPLLDVDASASFWHVLAKAQTLVQLNIAQSSLYLAQRVARRPARLLGVHRSNNYLVQHTHPVVHGFCPVELYHKRYWAAPVDARDLLVEYDGYCYWLANEAHAKAFERDPDAFINANCEQNAKAMVPLAPVDASLLSLVSVADCNVPELKGYCPVTFQQGHGPQDWASLVRGHVFYRASYESKVFMFVSEAQRRRFLAEPVRYVNQHLPIKLPPEVADVLAKNYPGRLEQELSGLLNQTLLTLGSARPKYLCIDPRASACFFLALCFKTHAKKLPDRIRRHYETQRSTFEAECRLCKDLKRALTPVNASCGTPIKGIRAAKGIDNQQATPSHDDLEELRRRFDAVVGSTPSEARTRALERFLAYAQM